MQKNRLGNFPTRFIIEPLKRDDIIDVITFFSMIYHMNLNKPTANRPPMIGATTGTQL